MTKLSPANFRHLREFKYNNDTKTRSQVGYHRRDTIKLRDMGLIEPCTITIKLETYRLTPAGMAALKNEVR